MIEVQPYCLNHNLSIVGLINIPFGQRTEEADAILRGERIDYIMGIPMSNELKVFL